MPFYVKIIIYTVCFAVVVGLCFYGYHYVESRAYDRGVAVTDSKWEKVQVQAKEDQVEAIQQWRDALRLQGIELQKSVADLGEQKVEEIKNVEHGKDMLLDAIYAGTIKLHLPTQTRPGNGSDSGRSGDESADSSTEGRCVGQTTSELHPNATAFLFRLTGRADTLADDYNYLVDYTKLLLDVCAAR